MAATSTRSKTPSKPTTSKKSAPSSTDKSGLKLEVRYPRVMKPNRVQTIVVQVPKAKKKDEPSTSSTATVVVRASVPGALVTPTEQRLELAPGNQVLFHVTAVAKG